MNSFVIQYFWFAVRTPILSVRSLVNGHQQLFLQSRNIKAFDPDRGEPRK
jgi:hypothetical protein